MQNNKLIELRKKIDEIDHHLVSNLSKRRELVREVGMYKKANSLKPLDQNRWQEVLLSRKKWGDSAGLDSSFVGEVFELIHTYSLLIEGEICHN